MKKYSDGKSKRSKRKGGGLSHIGMERRTIKEESWRNLSSAAKIFYWHLKGRYNGSNNGEIEFPYSKMRGVRGCSTNQTISKAIKELKTEGWIEINAIGGMYRKENFYKLTFKHDLYGA